MNENKEIRTTVISSLIWKLLERGGTQGVQFIVQIILARLLLPSDYGVLTLVTIFISIANVFMQSGFTTALIQRKNIDEEYTSSMFYLMLITATILYILLFLFAPIIANFYNEPLITPIMRILGITLFFGAVNSIQNAIISRNMQFKKYFYSSILAIITSGIIGVILAYIGCGVWTLVLQQLINIFVSTLVLWFTVKWRPKLMFSLKKVKELFSYGWKILCAALIEVIYNDLYGLAIGKLYNSEMVGYYNRGKQFPEIIVSNINGSVSSVMLPTLSTQQDDIGKMKSMVKRSIMVSSFIVFPMLIGLIAVAEPMVRILLTDKWMSSVPFLQILCFTYSFYLIDTANLQAIKAIGRTDVYLKLEIIKRIIGVTILVVSIPFGINVMLMLQPIFAIIANLINAYPNSKFLNYSIKEQYKDILPCFIISLIMGIIVYLFKFIIKNSYLLITVQVILGIIIYILVTYILKLEAFTYTFNIIKETINKKKNIIKFK